jgi:hypothetical protein
VKREDFCEKKLKNIAKNLERENKKKILKKHQSEICKEREKAHHI